MITLEQVYADPKNDLLVIDFVEQQLIAQGCKSGKPNELYPNGIKCFYRGSNGTKCAVGHLIKDEEYIKSMEGCHVSSLNLVSKYGFNQSLLIHLQRIHDNNPVEFWSKAFQNLRQQYSQQ